MRKHCSHIRTIDIFIPQTETNMALVMQLERLKLFAELVNGGSFTRTADKLGVSKAFLSKHIKELEYELSTQLLIRNTRTMRLTPSGEALFNHTNKLRSFWQDTQRLVQNVDQSLVGDVSFTAPAGLMTYRIMPALQSVLATFSDIHLNVQTGNQTYNLLDAHYDFAVRITRTPPQDMIAQKLFDFDYVSCATQQYLDKHGEPATPLAIEGHARLSLSYWQNWSYVSQDGPIQMDSQATYRFTDNELIKQGVKDHLGIARLPAYMIEQELETGELVGLFNDFEPEQRSVYLVYPQTIKRPMRVQKIMDCIKEHCTN
ncbi:LysR family transcriptional regulator [Aliiglaciecola sp. M165]|nr:LysR family transcriptional regulator [Aliiglaciecola sp. M165]